jgi:hypothetical protein
MSDFLALPRIPTAILHFFANQPDFSVLLGDVTEEFQQRARKSGARAAKVWFWREVFRNVLALTFRELSRTPVLVAAIALGCVAAVNLTTGIGAFFFVQFSKLRLLVSPYSRWEILVAVQLLTSIIVGWASAKAAVGREWALALIFPLFSMAWTVVGDAFLATHIGAASLGHLPRVGAFWLGSLWIRRSKEEAGAL